MFDFLKNVLINLASEPATRMHPGEKRPPMRNTRGQLGEIDIAACVFCGACARRCPSQAITVSKQDRSWEVDRFKCVVCGVCVESCPKGCLKMDKAYKPPSHTRYTDRHVQHPEPVADGPDRTRI